MIGDTIVVNTLAVGTAYAHADRVFATVTAIDGPRQRVRIAINKDGVTFTGTASFTYLGDAAAVMVVTVAMATTAVCASRVSSRSTVWPKWSRVVVGSPSLPLW